MSLIFEPDRVAYDPERQALRLFATEDFMLVRCAVSKAALAALEDDALGGPHAMATTYRRHRERIQELAVRKYRERRFETGGFVVVAGTILPPSAARPHPRRVASNAHQSAGPSSEGPSGSGSPD